MIQPMGAQQIMNDKSGTEIRSSTNQRTGCGGNLAKI